MNLSAYGCVRLSACVFGCVRVFFGMCVCLGLCGLCVCLGLCDVCVCVFVCGCKAVKL